MTGFELRQTQEVSSSPTWPEWQWRTLSLRLNGYHGLFPQEQKGWPLTSNYSHTWECTEP